MKLGARIFICYLVIFAACFFYPVHWMLDNLRVRYLEGVEEPLVDQANILASQVGLEMSAGTFDPQRLRDVLTRAQERKMHVQIYDLLKTGIDTNIYITDAAGLVLFDSRDPSAEGKSYANWRDVQLTLAGKYGARTTRRNEEDPNSSVLYVAAPIIVDGQIVGSLTVAKPTTSINAFIQQVRPRVIEAGVLSLATAIVLSLVFSIWLTRPIKRLINYAEGIRENRRTPFPELGTSEIAELGEALRKMQETLEGKQYVEEYVQNLTHEIKSPLSAIRGAAELLDEEMPPQARARFLANIRNEGARIARIIDTMLELAALENRRLQPQMEKVDLHSLLQTVLESKQPFLSPKRLQVTVRQPEALTFTGNIFLLHQALANLLQNAIEFSPEGGRVMFSAESTDDNLILTVEDEGPGIPDYALGRVFEKFYSLQRPDTCKKSTGLGLNVVWEVAALHHGTIELANRYPNGARAVLTLPLSLPTG